MFGPESIFLSSFTRAAAAELAGRQLPVPEENIGTLHAHCYRIMNRPEIAEEHIDDFNEAYPELSLTKHKVNADESALDQVTKTETDKTFQDYQIYRAKMIPQESWPLSVKSLHHKWQSWKDSNNLVDYTDMIEHAIDYDFAPPVNARVGIFDEAQDFTPLQLKLVRKWGETFDYFLLAGDDDQLLYSFAGATPDAFLNPPLPDDKKRFLTQSYRVPSTVQAVAESWIKRVSKREPKTYKPRDERGSVKKLEFNYHNAGPIIEQVQEALEEGSVMILASCGYMLGSIIKRLRDEGIPFSNKYRRNRGDWNPLTPGSGISTRDRIHAYAHPEGPVFGQTRLWTPTQLRDWMDLVKAKGVVKHGAKKKIEKLNPSTSVDQYLRLIAEYFDEENFNQAAKLDLDWLFENMTAAKKKSATFPLQIIKKTGWDGFDNADKITVGTIHSVKGGQADTVFLAPDLSIQSARGYKLKQQARDSVIRQMYVGITRARKHLRVLQPASPNLGVKLC